MSQRSQREKKIPKSDLSSPGLIFQVQKHPIIWDPNRLDHSDRGAVEAAFNKISTNFYGNVKGQDCAEMWKNICRRRGEHKRRKAGKETSGSTANPRARPFKYANEMSFLDAVPGDPPGEGNLEHINHQKILSYSSSESEEELENEGDSEESENEEGQNEVGENEDSDPDSPPKLQHLYKCEENEVGENENSDPDSPPKLQRLYKCATYDGLETVDHDSKNKLQHLDICATADDGLETANIFNYTMHNEDKDILYKEKLQRKKCKKQVKFANRREEMKIKIAEQVKQHKKTHYSRKVSSVKTRGGGSTVICSLNEVLLTELRNIKEDDEFDLFFRSLALRLQRLPSAAGNALMADFWNETYTELYKK